MAGKIKIDRNKIRTAVQSGIPLIITTYTLPHEMEEYISEVIRAFLEDLNQGHMTDSLVYCVQELINNSKKANTKRVYFQERNLDLNNPKDYETGMKDFKIDTISDINHYLRLQKENGLYVKVILQAKNNKIRIEIRNNCELTVTEYKRIHDKITRSLMYTAVEDGISQFLDDTEGAGLGLAILMLVLRRIGLAEENYQVICENGETITRVILPFSEKSISDVNQLSTHFVNLIDGLPEFPENITAINRLINDPNSRMSDIAARISNDVALTGELLKMVNSAAFALSVPCRSIADAVKFSGLRGIRNLLFSIGSIHSLMDSPTEEKKKLWDHSYKVAFYAYNLARNFCKAPGDRGCVEDSYVCGLLHDMGKIVFETAHPDILSKIEEKCKEQGVSQGMFERMIAGANHGEIGAMIAEKWNFPPVIVSVIRYHHDPLASSETMRKLTCVIYISDMMVHYSEGDITFEQMDMEVLKQFNLDKEERFLAVSDRLSKSFGNEA